jgi:hypothetical protein
MATRIIVMADGTWDILGKAVVMSITDEAFNLLQSGCINVDEFQPKDVIEEREIE